MKPYLEAPGVHRVDLNWQGLAGQVAAYLVEGGDDALAVVESGPGSTLPTLLDAIRAIGREPEEVTHVLVTHVHLDHAGAAGALLHHAPRASVHVHPRGARHLLDPSRLLRSASMLYGERMDEMWGAMLPVPGDRLVVLEDEDEVRVGGRVLRALDTPGHAVHHHAYSDPDAGLVFTGDVGGIRLGRAPYVCAPTPPPDIDLDAWQHSLSRLRALRPAMLLPTHFGGVDDAEWHLDDLAGRLHSTAAWARAQAAAGATSEQMASSFARLATSDIVAATGGEAAARAYEQAVPYPMMSAGLERWLRVHADATPTAA